MVVRSGKGLRFVDIWVLCHDSVVVTVAQLAHHRSAMIKGGLQALLDDLHMQYGVRVHTAHKRPYPCRCRTTLLKRRPAHCTCGRWACTHKYTDDGMRRPTPRVPVPLITRSTRVSPPCNAHAVDRTINCPPHGSGGEVPHGSGE